MSTVKIVVRVSPRGPEMPQGFFAAQMFFPQGDSVHEVSEEKLEAIQRAAHAPNAVLAVVAQGEAEVARVLAPPKEKPKAPPPAGPGRPLAGAKSLERADLGAATAQGDGGAAEPTEEELEKLTAPKGEKGARK